MSAFDVTLNAGAPALGVPSQEQLDGGVPPAIEVIVPIALPLPISPGPGQPPLMMQAGVVRFELNKKAALDFFKKGLEETEKLPEEKPTSKLVTAQSLDGVDQAAAEMQRFSDGS